MIEYYKQIGSKQPEFKLDEDIIENGNDIEIKDNSSFTPPYKNWSVNQTMYQLLL